MDPTRIAVIEDDASVRDAITMLLQAEGWAVEPYASGQQFLSTHGHTQPPSCIVLDLILPGANGVEVLTSLSGADISTVVLTAYPSSDVAAQVRGLDVEEVLTKPVQPARLVSTLRRCLDGR
ncbi:MAG: response regulator transcription factor [Gammaproteobacteria bacterium]